MGIWGGDHTDYRKCHSIHWVLALNTTSYYPILFNTTQCHLNQVKWPIHRNSATSFIWCFFCNNHKLLFLLLWGLRRGGQIGTDIAEYFHFANIRLKCRIFHHLVFNLTSIYLQGFNFSQYVCDDVWPLYENLFEDKLTTEL